MTSSRVEVVTSVERRRRWPRAEKERLVALSLEPGASVSEVARAAGLHVSQLFRWRRNLCRRIEPMAAAFLPVKVGPSLDAVGSELPTSAAACARRREDRHAGRIEIELGSGVRVRLEGDVERRMIGRVLDALRDR